MRRISNPDNSDTLVAKVKSTINSTLLLDIVNDISTIDGRRVNVISFEQKEGITLLLYKGKIPDRFEVNPAYVHKAKENLVLRRIRGLDITPEKADYYISYKQH